MATAMSVNNPFRLSSPFCLICIQCISSDQEYNDINTSPGPGRPSSVDLENVFKIFCEYMNFNKPRSSSKQFDSIGIGIGIDPASQDKFPVCHKCFEKILELYEFHQERKRLADLIAKYVYNFTAKIIENPLQSLEEIQLYWSPNTSTEPNIENKTDFCTDDIKTEKDDLHLLDLKDLDFKLHPEASEDDLCTKVSSFTQPSSFFLSEWIDLRKEIIKRYSVEVSMGKNPNNVPDVPVSKPLSLPIPITNPKPASVVSFEERISAAQKYSECSRTVTVTVENSRQEQEQCQDVPEDYFSDADRSECDVDSNLSCPTDHDVDESDRASDFNLDNAKNSEAGDDDAAADCVPLPIALRKPQRSRRKDILLPKVQDDLDLDPSWDPSADTVKQASRVKPTKRKHPEASQIKEEKNKAACPAMGRSKKYKEIGPNRFSVGDFTFEKIGELYKCGCCVHSNRTFYGMTKHLKRKHIKRTPNSHKFLEVAPGDYLYADKFPASKVFETYKCGTCEYMTEKLDFLKRHLSEHFHSEQPRKPKPKDKICEICGKGFASLHLLRVHALCHSEDRPFTCEFCAKSYKTLHGLNIHLESHTGQDTKKFVCEVCGYKNRSRQKLEMHMATHYKGTIYPCDECDKTYTWPAGLEYHKRHKHDPRWMVEYPCDLCDMKFRCKSSLPRHIRVVHMGEKSQDVYKRTGVRNPNLKEDRRSENCKIVPTVVSSLVPGFPPEINPNSEAV